MTTALEAHRLELLRAASHHLPTIPPRNHWDCLAFRQISHRLIGWDRLYAERTGQEFIFQNYFDESPFGPELLYAVYPRVVLNWDHPPVLSDTIIFADPDRLPDQGLEKHGQQEEDYESDGTESSIITSDDSHEGGLGAALSRPPRPPRSIRAVDHSVRLQRPPLQPAPATHHPPLSPSLPTIPRRRKPLLLHAPLDPTMAGFKRPKILPA